MTIQRNSRIGRYEIGSLIGVGGMGEVYLAKDTTLGRSVALKLLRSDLISNERRLRRFVQEAFATSRLNHPNIVTLYEAEYQGPAYFIAMEMVEGVTLAQMLAESKFDIGKALDISIQVSRALAAAHEAGITHRDIKPNNIMLRPDGFVKVLDFGLAKLLQPTEIDREAVTLSLVSTEDGTVIGTLNYMSPEQARGLPVDARSDLWSLGCVLYEMITGHPAFDGATRSEVIARIKESRLLADEITPEVLRWIITKTLRHNCDERYQTARELEADLTNLKRQIDTEIDTKRSAAPPLRPPSTQAPSTTPPHETNRSRPAIAIQQRDPKPKNVTEIARQQTRIGPKLIVGLLVVIVTAVAFGIYKFTYRQKVSPADKPAAMEQKDITHLISGYGVGSASISRDGRQVAYIDWREDKPNLWIRQMFQDISSRIVTFAQEDPQFFGTTISPDGTMVYYVMAHKGDPRGTLYRVPAVTGRDPQAVRHDINSPVALSPNGRQFAFLEYEPSGESRLIIANLDEGGEAVVRKIRKAGDSFGPITWSPNGDKVAYAVNARVDCCSMTLVEISVRDGEEKRITSHTWGSGVGGMVWLKDGSGLLLTAIERRGGRSQIWHVSYPDGTVKNIVNDLTHYGPNVSVTDDGSTMVVDVSESVWAVGVADKTGVRWITNGRYDGIGGAAWTPDGQIIYVTQSSGNYDICIMNGDGSNNKLLFSDPSLASSADVSPDGKYIVFSSERQGDVSRLWRIDIDGSHLKRLSDGYDFSPNFTPDGQWVIFNNQQSGRVTPWRVPIDGGTPVPISDKVLYVQTPSPDGKLLSCTLFEGTQTQGVPVLFSMIDNSIVRLDAPPGAAPPAWWHHGRDYLYLARDSSGDTFWTQSINSGKRTKIASFTSSQIQTFDVHIDDRIVLSQRLWNSEIAVVRNFK